MRKKRTATKGMTVKTTDEEVGIGNFVYSRRNKGMATPAVVVFGQDVQIGSVVTLTWIIMYGKSFRTTVTTRSRRTTTTNTKTIKKEKKTKTGMSTMSMIVETKMMRTKARMERIGYDWSGFKAHVGFEARSGPRWNWNGNWNLIWT